jgi:succinyl-CoA synthetase beta subunit
MKIHEFQGKDLFRQYGVPVPQGFVAKTAEEAVDAFRKLGGKLAVVKSQIHAGGRGKGKVYAKGNRNSLVLDGGVKLAKSENEVREYAKAILGNVLITHQTGAEGKDVTTLLIEAGCQIKHEYYLGMTLDRATSRVTFMASTEGGMDIEKVAAEMPEKILKSAIDPAVGFQAYQGRDLAFGLGFPKEIAGKFVKFCAALAKLYDELDCSLVEINPLVLTADGDLLALDAKINFDENAEFRHPAWESLRDLNEEDPREIEAKEFDLSYVALDGNIGCMVNGAGLAMATMDIIKLYGGNPANFLDVGGGANKEKVAAAFKIILKDQGVKAILVNIFGGIMKCDVIAEGVIAAVKEAGLKLPLVVRLQGTNVDIGKKRLAESGLKITPADTMAEAAEKVVAAAKGA